MRVVLLVLSGDTTLAQQTIATSYPKAEVKLVSRSEVGEGSFSTRLKTLRALRPDVFVIATERLAWQRGQNLFMLFGALAGAREVLMLDAHGGMLRKSRSSLLLSSPAKFSGDAIASARTLSYALRELKRLEQAVATGEESPIQPKQNPRILFLRSTPGPGTQAGGAASHIKGVVGGLEALGAKVEVVTNDRIAGLEAPMTVIDPVTSGGTRAIFDINNNLHFTRELLPLVEGNPPDIIYQRYARFSWAGIVAALRTDRPLFLEYNGSEVWVGRHWDHVGSLDLLERYERLNLQVATRIFVVSEVERRNLEKRGVDSHRIVINPNAVDVEFFQPGLGGARKRNELRFNAGDVVVGFVGTFGPWHGVLVLAEAIKAVPENLPLKFLLVGSGSLFSEVHQLLQKEVEQRRVVLTGPVNHDEVPGLLDACDVLASPHVPLADGTEFFGSPTKLFEYMAMGKGIVASRLGQIGEVLQDEETALLVEPGNVEELVDAIVRLADSSELRERLGANARRAAVTHHTWKQNAQRVLDAYGELGPRAKG